MRKHPKHRNHVNPNHHIQPLTAARLERILYGESLPDKHSKERLEQARKEYAVPDMKTALSEALNEWAKDDEQTKPKEKAMPTNFVKTPDNKVRFVSTNNVSRETFDFVMKNPGVTRTRAMDAMEAKGFKKSSVSSLIGQYIRCAFFSQTDDGKLYCLLKEYRSLPSTKAQRALVATQRKPVKAKVAKVVKPAKSEGIAALKVDTGVVVKKAFDPAVVLDSLSVVQARALYDELKKIFGG